MNPATSAMIAVILVNYEQSNATIRCLRALQQQRFQDFKVWVIDNASPSQDVKTLEEYCARHAKIQFLAQAHNVGFAGGCNVGIRAALQDPECQAVWLLNNDAIPNEQALELLVQAMPSFPQAGLLGSTLYHAGSQQIQALGGRIRPCCGWVENVVDAKLIANVDYGVGASLLVKRQVLDRVGLLPEEYFLYFEDTDYALRAKRAGFSTQVILASRVEHELSLSMTSRVKLYYTARNQLAFFGRWYPWALPLAFAHLCYARILPRLFRWNEMAVILAGIVDFCFGRRGRSQRRL